MKLSEANFERCHGWLRRFTNRRSVFLIPPSRHVENFRQEQLLWTRIHPDNSTVNL